MTATPACSTETVDASTAVRSPLSACILTTTGSMASSASAGAWTTRSGPSATIVQVVVGDQHGDLQDHVPVRVEAGHLQVHPGQHAADRRLAR